MTNGEILIPALLIGLFVGGIALSAKDKRGGGGSKGNTPNNTGGGTV